MADKEKAEAQHGKPNSNAQQRATPQPEQNGEDQAGEDESHGQSSSDSSKQYASQGSHESDDQEAADSSAHEEPKPALSGWLLVGAVVIIAAVVSVIAVLRAVTHPRTDDAEVFANYIGMAPQVDGPIMELPIQDNEFVRAGTLLYVIDERPYKYALERALSDQAALEGQIEDRRRYINSQLSGVHVAAANILSSASNRDATQSNIVEAQANVADAKAAVQRAEADLHYAVDNLHRLEPLLAQQFVTVDQVDQARTLVETRTRAVQQAEAQVALAEARVQSTQSHFEQSSADVEQRRAQRDQAANGGGNPGTAYEPA